MGVVGDTKGGTTLIVEMWWIGIGIELQHASLITYSYAIVEEYHINECECFQTSLVPLTLESFIALYVNKAWTRAPQWYMASISLASLVKSFSESPKRRWSRLLTRGSILWIHCSAFESSSYRFRLVWERKGQALAHSSCGWWSQVVRLTIILSLADSNDELRTKHITLTTKDFSQLSTTTRLIETHLCPRCRRLINNQAPRKPVEP